MTSASVRQWEYSRVQGYASCYTEFPTSGTLHLGCEHVEDLIGYQGWRSVPSIANCDRAHIPHVSTVRPSKSQGRPSVGASNKHQFRPARSHT